MGGSEFQKVIKRSVMQCSSFCTIGNHPFSADMRTISSDFLISGSQLSRLELLQDGSLLIFIVFKAPYTSVLHHASEHGLFEKKYEKALCHVQGNEDDVAFLLHGDRKRMRLSDNIFEVVGLSFQSSSLERFCKGYMTWWS